MAGPTQAVLDLALTPSAGAPEPIPTLDSLTAPKVTSALESAALTSVRDDILQVASGANILGSQKPAPAFTFGSDAGQDLLRDRLVALGGPAEGSVDKASGETAFQSGVDLIRDIYISTVKMQAAWKVSNGVGKDVKMMLQAQ